MMSAKNMRKLTIATSICTLVVAVLGIVLLSFQLDDVNRNGLYNLVPQSIIIVLIVFAAFLILFNMWYIYLAAKGSIQGVKLGMLINTFLLLFAFVILCEILIQVHHVNHDGFDLGMKQMVAQLGDLSDVASNQQQSETALVSSLLVESFQQAECNVSNALYTISAINIVRHALNLLLIIISIVLVFLFLLTVQLFCVLTLLTMVPSNVEQIEDYQRLLNPTQRLTGSYSSKTRHSLA
ncbi:hypothetical protein MIR68_000950 [Amoeboaphelidium protococcarum]|nr:hypothetical protein MIR68_000950 [Amoeboaphelidium protococcarum]